MATTQTNVVEDGAHLIKSDDVPTILDPYVYRMLATTDFVVDGNQFYWVRIGSVNAKTLSSNETAYILCSGGFIAVAGVADGVVAYVAFPPAAAAAPPTLGGSIALYYVGVGVGTVAIDSAIGWTAMKLCPIVEKQFVAKDYRVLASDDTILIGIKKDNAAGIQELKKNGIDINKLTHLPKDGEIKQDL